MQIRLFPYERKVLEAFEREFALQREPVVGFAQSLNAIASMYELLVREGNDEFRAGRVVLIGFLNHAHHLLNGGLQALQVGNGPVWSACARGLIETFGACVLISERPDSAPNHLTHVKAKKLRDAAERGKPGLGKDIDRLNQIVHPASGAVYASVDVINLDEKSVRTRCGLHPPTANEANEGFVVLANLAALIVKKLEHLRSRPEVLSAGKPVWIRKSELR